MSTEPSAVSAKASSAPRPSGKTVNPEDRLILKGLLIGVTSLKFMTPFLQSGVAVLLPALGAYFQCTATELGLVSTVYCLSLAIFNLAAGRGGDKMGRRRLCLMSMVILVPASLAIAFAPSIDSVIALRFVQGIGTSCFTTSSLAMLVAASPDSMRGRVLGISSTGMYLGLSVGPLIGGWINTVWGWQVFFLLIAVWAAGSFAVMYFMIKREWVEDAERPYDWGGFLLFALGMCGTVMGCVGPLSDGLRLLCAGAGLVVLGLFALWEYRLTSTMPLLDVRVLCHNSLFILSTLASFMIYASIFSLTFFFSLYLQYAKGMNSAGAGLVLFVTPVLQVLCTVPCGWASDRIGAFPVALAGNVLAVAALIMMLFLTPASPIWFSILILAFDGLGMALFVTPNTVLTMTSVDPAHLSQASGAVGTVRTAGMVVSMVISTCALGHYVGDTVLSAETVPALMQAMKMSSAVFVALNLVSLGCSILRMPKRKKAATR